MPHQKSRGPSSDWPHFANLVPLRNRSQNHNQLLTQQVTQTIVLPCWATLRQPIPLRPQPRPPSVMSPTTSSTINRTRNQCQHRRPEPQSKSGPTSTHQAPRKSKAPRVHEHTSPGLLLAILDLFLPLPPMLLMLFSSNTTSKRHNPSWPTTPFSPLLPPSSLYHCS